MIINISEQTSKSIIQIKIARSLQRSADECGQKTVDLFIVECAIFSEKGLHRVDQLLGRRQYVDIVGIYQGQQWERGPDNVLLRHRERCK